MKIIKINYNVSKPVKAYREIKEKVAAMRRFIVRGKFEGYYNKAFAIAHTQVCETPMAFFVVSPDVMEEKMFRSDVIINPQILEAPLHKKLIQTGGDSMTIPNAIEYHEMCMSFPFRQPKRLNRYDYIKVQYQIPGIFGLKKVIQELTGIASQIFQHEYDHTTGKNIYFERENPVKWWELIGTPRSKTGTSLDDAGELGLNKAEMKKTEINTPLKQC